MKIELAISMAAALICLSGTGAHAAEYGYADVVLDFFDSGAGPIDGPYGGGPATGIGNPVPVSLDVVVGSDPGSNSQVDYLSLPMGSYVTVGFTDETIIDGPGNDIFIREIGPFGDEANIFVSTNLVDFVFLGRAHDGMTTSFDLATIGPIDPVQAVKIVGLDTRGSSPGFDVVNIRVIPGSIGPAPEPLSTPVPATLWVLAPGLYWLSGIRHPVRRTRR